jgi:hypothetical protein
MNIRAFPAFLQDRRGVGGSAHLFARIACFKIEANSARYRIDVLRKLGDKRSAIEQGELDALDARFLNRTRYPRSRLAASRNALIPRILARALARIATASPVQSPDL